MLIDEDQKVTVEQVFVMFELPKCLQEVPSLVQYAQIRLNMDQNLFPSHLQRLSNCQATFNNDNTVKFKIKKQMFRGQVIKRIEKMPRKELQKMPMLIPLRSQIVINPDAVDLIPGFYVPIKVKDIQNPFGITILTKNENIYSAIFHDLLIEEELDENEFEAVTKFLVGKDFYAKAMSPINVESEPILVDLLLEQQKVSHLLLEGILKNVAKPLKTTISDLPTPDLSDRKMVLQYLSSSDT